ncbi:hypothetical protein DENSPDRAFT_227784 [Dentipellis sp. KUC8613]|nr:hypothetical protein DENSPDRAFT_227784 [Dentipellis sp. KUC8613]
MAGPYVSEEGVQGEDEYEDESDDEDEDDDEDEQSITSATASASTCAGKKRSHSELSDDESDSELSDEGSTATLTGKTSKRPRKKRDDALFAFEQQCKPRSKTYTHPQFNDLVCRVILGDGSSCEVVSNTIQACFKHRDFHFGKRFACAVCDKSYGHMYCLKRHVKESPCRAQAGKRSCKQWEISMNNMRWMKPGWLRPRTGRGPA